MNEYTNFLLDIMGQFGGGRGEEGNHFVRFGLAAVLWGMLLYAARARWKQKALEHEKLLVWGFALGFTREIFMFFVFALRRFDIIKHDSLHIFFPPLEHTLSLSAVIVVAGAFLRYILKDVHISRRYLQRALGVTVFCYLASFLLWARFITADPTLKFSMFWADWLFHISASILLIIPIIILLKKKEWLSNIVAAALIMFFLDDFLMLFNLASHDIYKEIYNPIRHVLHMSAIPLLGYVYIKEQSVERSEAEESLRTMTNSLNERVRELNCLYEMSNLLGREGITLEEIFSKCIEIIRFSWQDPETACVRIAVEGMDFKTDNYRETAWKLVSDIKVHGNRVGDVEVSYLQEKTEDFEGPFSRGERNLLNAIATNFSRIIERKWAEELLKESEARFEDLYENAPDMFASVDSRTAKINRCNQTFLTTLGYKREEVIGKSLFRVYHPDCIEKAQQTFQLFIRTGEVNNAELQLKRKDGSRIEVSLNVSAVRDEQGDVIFGRSVWRDTTERKNLEKTLLEIEERERRRIGHDLHDSLGQILTGVSFKSRYLENILRDKSIPEADDAARITSLIDKSKEEVRRLAKGISPVDMDSEGLMAALEELVLDTKRTFNIQCAFICSKRIRIYQKSAVIHLYRIAQEAVTNAAKHGRPGCIDICLGKESAEITMIVRDDGAGITEKKKEGGLGLKIMQYRAGIIGASLDIYSGNNGGTLVMCALPDIAAQHGRA